MCEHLEWSLELGPDGFVVGRVCLAWASHCTRVFRPFAENILAGLPMVPASVRQPSWHGKCCKRFVAAPFEA